MKHCFVGLAFFVLCLGVLAPPAHAREWLAPDFFVDTLTPGENFAWNAGRRPTDCRANIAKIMCVGVSSVSLDAAPTMSRGCDEDDAKYVGFFEAVYDRLAPTLQKMFCSVRILRVEPMESIAYAGMSYNGAEVGFRKSVIDEGLELSKLMSWKEQLPFGGERDAYNPVSNLPNITVKSAQPPVQDLAYYVLTHEFGHLFDFANDINRSTSSGAIAKSWTAFSWVSEGRVRRDQDFPGRANVCYYNCSHGPIAYNKIPALYAGLDKSNFITMYAATNMYDDFAESLAMTLMAQDPTGSYVLADGQGNSYDGRVKLQSPQFAAKAAYVANFLQRTDLDYP